VSKKRHTRKSLEIIKARDNRRITAAEMKYMRRTAGYFQVHGSVHQR
jgi:hypothetical protein